MHPARSRHTDRPPTLLLTCSLTKVLGDPSAIASWRPGTTQVLDLSLPVHATILRRWLEKATTLVGTNLLFDLLYLLDDSRFRYALGHQSLVDLTILNYLHNEQRPEKSLKALCSLYGIHDYEITLKSGHRFPLPSDAKFLEYNARDSHHTVEACAEVARRIAVDHPPTCGKLSPYCLDFYSNAIWTAVRMASAGVPFSIPALSKLESACEATIAAAVERCGREGVILSGEGSQKSKDALIQGLVDEVGCHNHPLLQFTEKARKVSTSVENMVLLRQLLPPSHPALETLKSIEEWSRARKLTTSYLCPMLRHKSGEPDDTSSVLIPLPSTSLGVAYPSIYIVPSAFRDEVGGGGQLQVRYSFKKPALQTLPPPVKKCIRSRHGRLGCVLAFDLSQIDLRSAAIWSGEPSLLAAFNEGLDLHRDRAIQVWGPDIVKHSTFGCGDMRTDPRQHAKRFNFADLNWAGAASMRRSHFEVAEQILPHSFFENVVKTRPSVRPLLFAWQTEMVAQARREGVLYLPFVGVSRYFEGLAEEHRGEAVNFRIQGTSSIVMRRVQAVLNKSLPAVSARNPPISLMLDIYDAIFLDCYHTAVDEAKALVQAAVHHVATNDYWAMLSEHTGFHVPLKIGCETLKGVDE